MTQWGLDTLFNPAKRHMDDEKRRLQSTREEVGDNSGGKRIDLEKGKVVIHRSSAERVDADSEGNSDSAADSASAADAPASKSATPPSAAARRAAERRGRKAR